MSSPQNIVLLSSGEEKTTNEDMKSEMVEFSEGVQKRNITNPNQFKIKRKMYNQKYYQKLKAVKKEATISNIPQEPEKEMEQQRVSEKSIENLSSLLVSSQQEIGVLRQQVIELESSVGHLEDTLRHTNEVNQLTIQFLKHGNMYGEIPREEFQQLSNAYDRMKENGSVTITGEYEMIELNPVDVIASAPDAVAFATSIASAAFSAYLGKQVQCELQSAAILCAPNNDPVAATQVENSRKTQSRRSERRSAFTSNAIHKPPVGQVCHIDDCGFRSFVILIHMLPGQLGTNFISQSKYGPEFPLEDREKLLQTRWSHYVTPSFKEEGSDKLRNCMARRYEGLLSLTPDQFLQECEEPRGMNAGNFQAFRCDVIHAGPVAYGNRSVFFLQFKVKLEDLIKESDTQFRIGAMAIIAGASLSQGQLIARAWHLAGYHPGSHI